MARAFKDKIVVITGASTGIGHAMGVEFAKAGATVMLTSRNKAKLEETARIIKKNGGKVEAFAADLRDIKAIQKLAKLIKSKWNRVDVIVNVAGIYHSDKKAYYNINFQDYKLDEVLATLEVGITAPTILCHELLPMMKKNSKIVNMSGTVRKRCERLASVLRLEESPRRLDNRLEPRASRQANTS